MTTARERAETVIRAGLADAFMTGMSKKDALLMVEACWMGFEAFYPNGPPKEQSEVKPRG